jgi:hypothetical protein
MIPRVVLLAAILTLGMRPTSAEDITLTDGTVYKGATILHHDAATATILYDDGGAAVPIAKLSADLQKRLDYDPAAAQKQLASDAAAVAQEQALTSRTQALDSAVLKVWGTILHVRPDGVVAQITTVDKCAPRQEIVATTPINTLPGRQPDVVQTTVVGFRRAKIDLGQVFIETGTAGLVDQQHWRAFVWPVGTYTYADDDGHHHTIRAYTVSPDRAYAALAATP